MRKMICALAFLALAVAVYAYADNVLGLKSEDAIESMGKYYELPADTVDVLFVGSSHIGMNLDSPMLMEEYGIANYALWGGMQPVWNSYYFVKEALKTQKPKVVAVEVFLAAAKEDYSTPQVALKNIHGMKFSLDKMANAFASFEKKTDALEALWGMPYYHARYDELSEADFRYDAYKDDLALSGNTMLRNDVVQPLNLLDYASINDTLPLTAKNEKYLRMLIDLCNAKGTELVLLVSPFEANAEECMRINEIERIAAEKGIRCLNYLKNIEETGIDPSSDFYDIGHLNGNGIRKLTAKLGDELTKSYDLPDRRLDERHIWHTGSVASKKEKPVFALEEVFRGDGIQQYVDSGVKLYENRFASYTLLARVDTAVEPVGLPVYFSCFSDNVQNGYYGLLLRKEREGYLTLILGSNISFSIPIEGETVDLAIVKDEEVYSVYADGKLIVDCSSLPCGAYGGMLLVGCQEKTAGGDKMRYSRTRVLNLEVYNHVLGQDELLSWTPDELTEAPAPIGLGEDVGQTVYELPEQFMGDNGVYAQERAIDTGVVLYRSGAARYTIFSRITLPEKLEENNVFFSCFAEDPNDYRGLLVRQTQERQLDVIVGTNCSIPVPVRQGETIDLAIVNDAGLYSVYVNGLRVSEPVYAPCSGYEGTLLIGCQEDSEGKRFRYSRMPVHALSVVSGAMTDEEIAERQLADAAVPKKRELTSAACKLENAFKGDGKERFVDLGVKLYDAPAKDWTMKIIALPDNRTEGTVYASCFSEEVGAYRGFLLRSGAEGSFMLFAGDGQSIRLDSAGKQTCIVLVKQGDRYTVYQDGEKKGEWQSACAPYDGNLLVGCQETVDGEKFRFSEAAVSLLEVQDGAVSPDEAVYMSADVPSSRF